MLPPGFSAGVRYMNWEAIGALGEVVGAAAVVLTLLYLARQVRDGSKQIRLNTTSSLTTMSQDSVDLHAD